ncbi:helix-turn-helix domain-containing protein [Variovorax sp. efr-133-TYG-130]|uniref:AraC-like ligand-binding domain-containing protein n=1 Tax=Variovorax sp. efr-133-TYG-130 TaxID=3040327 RepID=UPI002553A985|nr:helix-turn-helix domain-containing protein [Variovorax sp. efr-133-TYG-130]
MTNFDYSTRSLRGEKCHDYWSSIIAERLIPAAGRFDRASDFQASLSGHELGPLTVCRLSANEHEFRRTASHVRTSTQDDIVFALMQAGSAKMSQNGVDAVLGAGDIVLYDSARPFEHHLSPESMLLIRIGRRHLAARFPRFEDMMSIQIDGHQSIGRVLRCMAEEAWHLDDDAAPGPCRSRFAWSFLDMLSACLERMAGDLRQPESARYRKLFLKAQSHISERLHEVGLCAEDIADALYVSSRTLARAFAHHDCSVSKSIWELRLKSGYALLNERRVAQISDAAFQTGFNDLSHFSRLFKRRFGKRPSDVLRSGA